VTPTELALLHLRVFTVPRPWSVAEFAGFLADPSCFLCHQPGGFLLGRVIADEAELLTLAVAPEARRQGIGAALLAEFMAQSAARGAGTAFLEVAADNRAALTLYHAAGFTAVGRRRGYYTTPAGQPVDALVLRCPLPPTT
jgi:ribosomal-protein-alanine N-acetyltransferase